MCIHVLSLGACTLGRGFLGLSVGLDVEGRSLRCDAGRYGPTSISSPDVLGVPDRLGSLDLDVAPFRAVFSSTTTAEGVVGATRGTGGGARFGEGVVSSVSISTGLSGVLETCEAGTGVTTLPSA